MIPDCVTQRGPKAIAIYEESMRVDGSERFAEMLAMQSPPACMTDSVFLNGIGTLDKQLSKRSLAQLKANAEKMGVTLTGHEMYHPGLCRNSVPLDPLACVNTVKELKDKLAVTGRVLNERTHEVTCTEPVSDPYDKPKHKLNPRIVKRIMRQRIKENPDLARKPRRDLVESIIDKHGKR